ncbi:chemotaxis protein CheW [Parendozoicomonas sp. Alg238-R29]|uniref:chemotaxis protein CheW n=1 Tax=Parendozoicomonas sp. Alg238-R29 TaxID=2993446 RepID=UPI00248F2BA6|nr:chemotaxis protein CheW [Parendozoicomonas sp. Alg238-R29]
MAENTQQIAAMLVSVSDDVLLVPGAVVAEMIPYQAPNPVQGKPEWFLGEILWRDETVPVVSFELAGNKTLQKPTTETRLAILNGVSRNSDLPFYAIPVEGIPRSVKVEAGDVMPLKTKNNSADVVSMGVSAAGSEAIIPDLDKLEEKLLSA